jgi:hypothetical protein
MRSWYQPILLSAVDAAENWQPYRAASVHSDRRPHPTSAMVLSTKAFYLIQNSQ